MRAATFKKAALCLAAILLSLALAEIGVRLLGLDGPARDVGMLPHPLWHHWHEPNHQFNYSVPGETTVIPVQYNTHGMRQSRALPVNRETGQRRIAVLGDSFVEGLQVREEENLCYHLEALLSGAEVLNFGCSGFSSSLEWVLLRDWVQKQKPDQVVLLHHFSDVTEDWQLRQLVRWEGDVPAAIPASGKGTRRKVTRIAQQSQLFRLLGSLNDRPRHRAPLPGASLQESFDAIVHEPYTAADEEAWAYSLGFVKRMAEVLRADGIPFLVVLIPLGPQVEPVDATFAATVGYRYLNEGKLLEHTGYQNRVSACCDEHGIACLDLLPHFRSENPSGEPRLYLQRDQHWTAAGHELAARAIASCGLKGHFVRH